MSAKLLPASGFEKTRLALSRALTTDFKVPAPKGLAYYDFQRVGAEFKSITHNVLNADPPGVGKTIQEIAYMNHAGVNRGIILAPASLLYNWRRELETWHLGAPVAEIFNPKTFNEKKPPRFLLVSYYWAANAEAIKKIMRAGKVRLLTIDECQNMKNPESKRTKYVFAANGLKTVAERVHALSGTPLVNRPMEMWPLINSLCPKALGGMSRFEYGLQFCGGFQSPWGWDFSGASKENLPILGAALRSHFMIRRLKSDVLPFLPARYPPNLVYLDPTPEGKRALELFDEEAIRRSTVTYDFTELSAARKELGLSKVAAAVSYIGEILRSGHEKVIVFAHHKEVVAGLCAGLNKEFGALAYTGGLTPFEKDRRVREFQNESDKRVFVLSLTAGGVGLTLTRADYVVLVEWSWVPGENEQAIDRTHRIGQLKGVVTDYLVYGDTLDERQLKYCFRKQNVFNAVFN